MAPPAIFGDSQVNFSFRNLHAWAPNAASAEEWAEWSEGLRQLGNSGEPALSQMPPILRRHAGKLGKLACSPAYDSLAGSADVPTVFSARYGEVSRSVDLLTSLAGSEELSPTVFGLSVHNATPGLFSMARKDTANSISIAAGHDSAEIAIIEACGLLADGVAEVLVVAADSPLPEVYEGFADTEDIPFGWSCFISAPDDSVVSLRWTDVGATAIPDAPVPPAALLPIRVLTGSQASLARTSGHRTWIWSRHDAIA
ncbi:MAG: beta-ketoacyl synthase chain length factor [Gemmatimonas sp.]